MNSIWRFFISLKLTFVLLGIVGLGALVGMSFDQTLTYDQYLAEHASFSLSFFELYDTFHSWWFSLAIYLLALNLIACSIERLPRIYFDFVRPRPYLSHRRLLGLTFKTTLPASSKNEAQNMITTFMGVRHEKTRMPAKENYFFYDKMWFGRFGVYVVHIALLIVMFSSIYTTQNGVDGHIMIDEGKMGRFVKARGASGITYNYDLGFYVGCHDFRLSTFVDNSPMEFESDLFISLDREHKLIEKTVRVNEPLTYAGFTFYQSNYQPLISERTVLIEVAQKKHPPTRHRLKLNEPLELKDGTSLTVEKIYEDFAGLGQALRIATNAKDGEATYFHIFRRYKDFDSIVRAEDFSVTFLEADQQYRTGLSVGFVPGISIIFSGFVLLIFGLYLCFFTTPIRYYARIEMNNGVIEVMLAASGFRMQNTVKEIFSQKILELEQNYGEPHHV